MLPFSFSDWRGKGGAGDMAKKAGGKKKATKKKGKK